MKILKCSCGLRKQFKNTTWNKKAKRPEYHYCCEGCGKAGKKGISVEDAIINWNFALVAIPEKPNKKRGRKPKAVSEISTVFSKA